MVIRDVSWTMSTTDLASQNLLTTTTWTTVVSCQSIGNSRVSLCPSERIPKLREWFSSQECQALDASDFYSEKYWMNADEEVEDMEDDDMYMVSDVNSTEKQDKKRRWQEKRLISRFHVKKHPYKPQSRTVQWTRHLFFGVEELRQNIVANHHKQTLRYWFEYQSHESQKVLFSRNIYCEYLSLASRYNFDFESISLS